jgi:hypothetical protein
VSEPNDGGRKLSFSERSSTNLTDDPKLTLVAEELTVEREAVETGRLRVSKQTHTREVALTSPSLERARKLRQFQLVDRFSRCHPSAARAKLL